MKFTIMDTIFAIISALSALPAMKAPAFQHFRQVCPVRQVRNVCKFRNKVNTIGAVASAFLHNPSSLQSRSQKHPHSGPFQFLTSRSNKVSLEKISDQDTGKNVSFETRILEWKVSDQNNYVNKMDAVFSREIFAASNCWGRNPFLLRGAFDPVLLLENTEESNELKNGKKDDLDDGLQEGYWPSWENVVQIAADEDAEARVISQLPGDMSSFELQWGSLSEDEVQSWLSIPQTPNTNKDQRRKTLVVNDIDRFYPPLSDWIANTFSSPSSSSSILPKWRLDDGQISLAENQGGIGPHVDNYDVFLIQMSGSRVWQVGKKKLSVKEEMERLISGLDVRVLDNWTDGVDESVVEYEEVEVLPGDLLYLPPRLAHCGTSTSHDCMTLSVGCRAPSVSDLVSKLAETLSTSMEDYAVRRYTDEDLLVESNTSEGSLMGTKPSQSAHRKTDNVRERDDIVDNGAFMPGELTATAKQRARSLAMESLSSLLDDELWWDEFFGKYVTEPKRVRNNYPIPLDDEPDGLDLVDENDIWDSAELSVTSVLSGRGALYHAEGITFAHSSFPLSSDPHRVFHRLFINGEMWEEEEAPENGRCNSEMNRLFTIISNNRRMDQSTFLEGIDCADDFKDCYSQYDPDSISFLQELVSAGLLYGTDN